MSNETDFVKSEILGNFFKSNSDVGHVLNERMLFQMMIKWNPKQKDALTLAAEELVSDGVIEEKNGGLALTQKGVDNLYPPVGSFVRDAILSSFSESQSRVGHVLNVRPLIHKSMHWNPKQKAALEPTVEQLCTEGLMEKQGDNYALTQKGYDAIY